MSATSGRAFRTRLRRGSTAASHRVPRRSGAVAQEHFQLPVRAMGYEPVHEYAKDKFGVQAAFADVD
ncbi:hypothetical protein SALBM311S_08021 [Streptomyces alboniger]